MADQSSRPSDSSDVDSQNGFESPVNIQKPNSARFKDRSTGLIVFGALQIIMGGFGLLMVLLMFVLFNDPAFGFPADAKTMIPIVGIYGMGGLFLIVLGTGSIRAKRWARALTLVLAWMSLISGCLAMITMIFWMPGLSNQVSREGLIVFYLLMLAVMLGVYCILPAIFVCFYQSENVRATCDFRNPGRTWTDGCPLPVLGLVLMLGFAAVITVFNCLGTGSIPVFGVFVRGPAGIATNLGFGIVFGYLAWATYRLKMSAWWATLIFYSLLSVSYVYTLSQFTMIEFYRKLGYSVEQLKFLEESEVDWTGQMPAITALSFLAVMVFMIWVRKYFVTASSSTAN